MRKLTFTAAILTIGLLYAIENEINYQVVEHYEFERPLIETQWSQPTQTQSSRLLYGITANYNRRSKQLSNVEHVTLTGCTPQPQINVKCTNTYFKMRQTLGITLDRFHYEPDDPLYDEYGKNYDIYSINGELLGKTYDYSPGAYLFSVYGYGRYISYDRKTKMLLLVDLLNDIYNEVDIESVLKENGFSRPSLSSPEGCTIIYNSNTQECLFSTAAGRENMVALIGSEMDLLWVKKGGFRYGEFSPSGEYIALKGYPDSGASGQRITIIDRLGNLVSFNDEIGPGTWLDVNFYEEENIVLTYTTRYILLLKLDTGEIIRKLDMSGISHCEYSPISNNIVKTGREIYSQYVAVYDASNTSKEKFYKVDWSTNLSSKSKLSKNNHVSISKDGKEITVAGDHDIWILQLEE